MNTTDLAQRLARRPFSYEALPPGHSNGIKLTFLLNVIRLMTDEVEGRCLTDARDALAEIGQRKFINSLLGIPQDVAERYYQQAEHERDTCETALPLEERDEMTKERLICLLRPDPKMLIEVEKIEVDTEPSCTVYQMVIEDGCGGSWSETFTTEDQLRSFLRGVRVTFAMSPLRKLLPDFGDGAPLKFTEQSCIEHLP